MATKAKILVLFHGLLFLGDPPELSVNAFNIVHGQMERLRVCGLLSACSEFIVCLNGGEETRQMANLIIPPKAKVILHGMDSRNECSTIAVLEQWLKAHAGQKWYVLYFHAKNSSRPTDTGIGRGWRECMMRNCVRFWHRCVADLDSGYESVGCHWMTGKEMPLSQSVWAGNFWWAKSDFLLTLPSIMDRARIKSSGLKALDARYEAEVWIGNGRRLPLVKDYHGPNWTPAKAYTCYA